MVINYRQATLEGEVCDVIIVGISQNNLKLHLTGNDHLKKICEEYFTTKDFRAKINEIALLYPQNSIVAKRLLLVGLGETEKFDLERVRQAVGTATRSLMRLGQKHITLAAETFSYENINTKELAQTITEGVVLAAYQFLNYKEIKQEEKIILERITLLFPSAEIIEDVEKGIKFGQVIAEAANFTRDLQNHPGNWVTPTRLAETAREMAKEVGLKCTVLDQPAMQKLKMGALLGVAKGSTEPPKFIILEHNASKSELKSIVFVGKGITFDSGGISLKPSDKMDEMKFDMSGGAAVMGALKAIAQLDIPLHVVGLIPATENLPSGSSMKPGDILRTSSGKTIEIVNTDAEGRLILADALVYAKRYKAEAVVDLATLTGACVVALGHYATGLFGKDSNLVNRLKQAGEKTGERLWELPLWDNYSEDIKSHYADIKNSSGRWGAAITAAAFLAEFAEGYPWAHLDIAGTAWADKDSAYIPKGGTGLGVRLLVQFLRDWLEV